MRSLDCDSGQARVRTARRKAGGRSCPVLPCPVLSCPVRSHKHAARAELFKSGGDTPENPRHSSTGGKSTLSFPARLQPA